MKFRDYLYGQTVTVVTDNNPLTYVMKKAKLDAHGHRWVSDLSVFDLDIVYRPGKANANADALSRISCERVNQILDETNQRMPIHRRKRSDDFVSSANGATGVRDPASRRAGQDESSADGVLEGNQIIANSGSDSTPAVSSSSLQSPASDFSEQPRPSEPPLQTQLSTVCSGRSTSSSGEDASDGRSKSGQTVGTGFMQSSGTSLLEAQQSDPAIHRVVELKLAQQRLSRRQAMKESGVVRKLLHVLDQLAVKDDLLELPEG